MVWCPRENPMSLSSFRAEMPYHCCSCRPCHCPPPHPTPPPHRHHHHEVDALDVLDVLAKTPGLYLVPELRYPFHCCCPCCCCCPCRCTPPHCHPPHCHHHDVVVLDVLTKTPALYLVPTKPITLTTFALITSNSLKFIPTCTHSHKYNYEYFVLVKFRSEVWKWL